MAWAGLAEAAELGKLGVRRLSAGSIYSKSCWPDIVDAFFKAHSSLAPLPSEPRRHTTERLTEIRHHVR